MADETKLQVKTITIPASATGSDTETLYIKDEQAREDIQAILDSKTATYKTEAKTDIITVDAVDELNTDIDNAKVDKVNPTATGALSLNAAEGETAGTNSVSINGLATGDYALAEGRMSGASGIASHAEGYYTAAMGNYSHTEGKGTAATRRSQHVFGEYNAVDTSIGSGGADRGLYVEIVGNGADSSHSSNARTLDWSGNENLTGNLTVEGKKINNINVPDVSSNDEVFALQSAVVLKADKAKINTLDGNNILATGDKTDIKVKTVANQKLIGAEGNINVLTVADYDASSATSGTAVVITKDTYDALVAVDAIRLQIAAGKIILNKVAKEGANIKFSSSIGGTNLNEDNYYIILSNNSEDYALTYYYEQTPYVKATSVAQTIYGQKTFNAGLATKGISATGDITATGKITAQSGAEITTNPLIINNVRISDGNNNAYGFLLPDSTNYAENKRLAITTDITDAINTLDITDITNTAGKTISTISETDGKVAATFQDIKIAESQVTNLVDDLANKVETAVVASSITNDNTKIPTSQAVYNYAQPIISDLSDIRAGAVLGDTAVQPADLKATNDLDNYTLSSNLATVATSGLYNDLISKPTLGTAADKNIGTTAGTIPILDNNGKLSSDVLPAIAVTDTFVAANEAAMLALSAQKGDVAVRTDESESYILVQEPASTKANWQKLLSPSSAVIITSVNGHTGPIVTLDANDVNALPDSTKYGYSLAVSGTSVSLKNQDGTILSTITTQDTNTNTWRPASVNGTQLLGTGTDTGAINFKAGNNVSISGSGNDITISATDTTYDLSPYYKKDGSVAMTGSIKYAGTHTTTTMMRFINNTSDAYGNGIAIGGNGETAVCAGECVEQFTGYNTETLHLAADGQILFYSNCDTWGNRKTMTFDTSGSLTVPNNVYANSDRTLKKDIKDITYNSIDILNNIKIREFKWKDDDSHNNIGVIAQELQEAIPNELAAEFINKDTNTNILSVNDSKLVYILIDVVQKQQKEIEELKNKIGD